MIKLLICIIILFAPAVYVSAHTASIDVPAETNEYISIPVVPSVYSGCRSDFGDIRIYDSKQNVLPYFIQTLTPSINTNENFYHMINSDRFVKNKYMYFDYALEHEYPYDILASSLTLKTTSDNFAKSVELYGSYDGLEWTFLQEDNIYSVTDAQNLSFKFSSPQKYTCYRIAFTANTNNPDAEPFFTDAYLYFNETIREELRSASVLDAEFSAETVGNATLIHLPSLKNMRLEYISIETDDMFKRNVSYSGKTQVLQKLTFGSETISDTVIRLDGMTAPEDFTLTIHNGDDSPININGIKASYYENYFIFKASEPPYRIEFGDMNAEKPIYDIENYKSEILSRPLTYAAISDIVFSDTPAASEKNNTQLIFNTVVCAAAAVLIIMLISALKKTGVK